jgi:hypothetical protein
MKLFKQTYLDMHLILVMLPVFCLRCHVTRVLVRLSMTWQLTHCLLTPTLTHNFPQTLTNPNPNFCTCLYFPQTLTNPNPNFCTCLCCAGGGPSAGATGWSEQQQHSGYAAQSYPTFQPSDGAAAAAFYPQQAYHQFAPEFTPAGMANHGANVPMSDSDAVLGMPDPVAVQAAILYQVRMLSRPFVLLCLESAAYKFHARPFHWTRVANFDLCASGRVLHERRELDARFLPQTTNGC